MILLYLILLTDLDIILTFHKLKNKKNFYPQSFPQSSSVRKVTQITYISESKKNLLS